MIKFIFSFADLEYIEQVFPGVDQKYSSNNCFNIWFEDAQKETYPISNDKDFILAAETYANLSCIKINVVENQPILEGYKTFLAQLKHKPLADVNVYANQKHKQPNVPHHRTILGH